MTVRIAELEPPTRPPKTYQIHGTDPVVEELAKFDPLEDSLAEPTVDAIVPIIIDAGDPGRQLRFSARLVFFVVCLIVTAEVASRHIFLSGYIVLALIAGAVGLHLTARRVQHEVLSSFDN